MRIVEQSFLLNQSGASHITFNNDDIVETSFERCVQCPSVMACNLIISLEFLFFWQYEDITLVGMTHECDVFVWFDHVFGGLIVAILNYGKQLPHRNNSTRIGGIAGNNNKNNKWIRTIDYQVFD